MPEDTRKTDPPAFYANVITMNLNVDELMIELRRYLPPHKNYISDLGAEPLKPLAPPSSKEITELEQIARVVLTYSAAKALMEYLVKAFPPTEDQRRKPQ